VIHAYGFSLRWKRRQATRAHCNWVSLYGGVKIPYQTSPSLFVNSISLIWPPFMCFKLVSTREGGYSHSINHLSCSVHNYRSMVHCYKDGYYFHSIWPSPIHCSMSKTHLSVLESSASQHSSSPVFAIPHVNPQSGHLKWQSVSYSQFHHDVLVFARYWSRMLENDCIPQRSVVGLWWVVLSVVLAPLSIIFQDWWIYIHRRPPHLWSLQSRIHPTTLQFATS